MEKVYNLTISLLIYQFLVLSNEKCNQLYNLLIQARKIIAEKYKTHSYLVFR